MKKFLSLVISFVMLAAMLSACAEKHSHKSDLWTATVEGHYQICRSSAKKINEGKHTLDDNNACKECGATLHAYSPRELEFTAYNKYGLIDYCVEYRMGKETLRRVYEYVYEKGKPVSYKVNEGTEICEEGIVVKKNGEYECLRTKRYYGDSYEVRIYDSDGFLTSITDYDKNGKVLNEQQFTYEKDSKGNTLSRTCYENGKKDELEKFALDNDGVPYVCEITGYNADGTVRYVEKYDSHGYTQEYVQYENGEIYYVEKDECVFDEKGELLSRKILIDDVLCYEYTYKYADYEYAYPKTILSEYTHYASQGDKYIDTYNDFGDIVLSKIVDSDGDTIREVKTEHTRDELGRVILEKKFEDDVLSIETVYEYDGNSDERSKCTETSYYDDGGKSVAVYNGNRDKLSHIEYDAEGNVVKDETYEYEYNENGNRISEKTYSDGVLIEEAKYSYDKDGNITLYETYENGVLTESWEYLYAQGSDKTWSILTWYYSDGGKRAINYLENGSISLDVQYDADGNYVHYYKYTGVKNDDGTETTYTHDENGKLLSESRRDSNGNRIEYTEYYSDGSKSVEFYYEDGDLERYCRYDKDGKPILEVVYGEDYSVITETQYIDGNKYVYTYNDDGTVTREVFDSNGKLISSETI